jgi:transmembrane sensor
MESASHQTEKRAAQWLAQRDSSHWTPTDQAALDQWLAESTANVVAYIRLESAWKRADRLQALGAGCPPGKVPTPEEFNLSPFFNDADGLNPLEVPVVPARATSSATKRRFPLYDVRFLSLAACFLLVIVGAWQFLPTGPDFKTPIGGTASVPMADGSHVTLNTDSAIRVALNNEERHVRLDHGEAFFHVAHDASRPFIVTAGDKQVIAVGTEFSVRRIGNDVRVVVTEGKVRLENADGRTPKPHGPSTVNFAGNLEANEDRLTLAAGNIASTDGNGTLVQRESLSEVEESLSWRTGYLIFHETTLTDAAAEFNRYNLRKIVIRDSAVGSIRFSGKFRTSDFEAFIRLIEGGFPIHAQHTIDHIILTSSTVM